jgi:hypothetical protein
MLLPLVVVLVILFTVAKAPPIAHVLLVPFVKALFVLIVAVVEFVTPTILKGILFIVMPLPISSAVKLAVAEEIVVEDNVVVISVPLRSGVSEEDDPPLVSEPPFLTYQLVIYYPTVAILSLIGALAAPAKLEVVAPDDAAIVAEYALITFTELDACHNPELNP